MLRQLAANTRTLLRFYARNRLILALAVVLVAVMGLYLVPTLLFESSVTRFELLRQISSQLNWFALVFVAGLGLFAIASHLRNRNLKMVLTKPCLREVWLASVMLSAGLVAVLLYVVVALATLALSLAWHIPYQWGFAYIAIDGFLTAMIAMSYLLALTSAVHPVVAVLLVLFVSEQTLYGLKSVIAGSLEASRHKALLGAASWACDAVYMVLPMLMPFSEAKSEVYSSLRVSRDDWLTLIASGSYAVLVSLFCFLLANYFLRRRSLT